MAYSTVLLLLAGGTWHTAHSVVTTGRRDMAYSTVLLLLAGGTWHTAHSVYTRQAMYLQSNNETRSHNRCCSGKAKCITCCQCVFVALCIQRSMGMRPTIIVLYCDLWPAPLYNIFPALSHKLHDFLKKKCY
jgi:hypothetical protein